MNVSHYWKMRHFDDLPAVDPPILAKRQHIRFFLHFLRCVPASLVDLDTHRLTTAFFSICGIDILNGLSTITAEFRHEIVEWIYHLQITSQPDMIDSKELICGFQGGSCAILKSGDRTCGSGHLAMTYTGLASLITLGDDLSKVDKSAVIAGVKALQRPDGSFVGALDNESDMRFVYCAACICYILNDFSGIDVERMTSFIERSIGYDGGIGQGPNLESHGGSTFCAVAALALTSNLGALSTKQIDRIKRWCLLRQKEGFSGRPNKPEDTCYSFWIGGTLALLDSFSCVHAPSNRSYIMSTQNSVLGGFSKWPDSPSDPLHAFFGLSGLSLMKEEGLTPIEPRLCITQRAHDHLIALHKKW